MNTKDLSELLVETGSAAQAAAQILSGYFGRISSAQVESKSAGVDLVSIADKEAEMFLRDKLAALLPDSGFIGEEFDDTQIGSSGLNWVVDPLDGTSNYLCGLPIWCVSIGLCDAQWNSQLGVVLAPQLGRNWTATLGGGAFCNGTPMQVRATPPGGGLLNSMLATGFPYDVETSSLNNLDYFSRMQHRFQKIRRLGSAAIDFAYLAEGTFDGMWELKLKPWDVAAGQLLLSEAGGCISRIDGSTYLPGDIDMVAASNPQLLDLMLRVLRGEG